MLAIIPSATLLGVDGSRVNVEVHVAGGMPGYTVVGLPDAAGRESRERVRAALMSSGLAWPQKRMTVNLSPATVRKTGTGLELAIALGLLVSESHLPADCLEGVGKRVAVVQHGTQPRLLAFVLFHDIGLEPTRP